MEMLELDRAPGFAAAVAVGDRLIWSGGFGLADVHREIVMSPGTLQNIGSISKTVTATAVMQLWDAGRFALDDDVNRHLPFTVRNPQYPETPITFRQLLTHRSSIKDGPAYGESYACGDPAVALGVWIEEYFTPGGEYFAPEGNFHTWEPGTASPPTSPRAYTNVGFGLLGNLVEHLADIPFTEFCRENIFSPLGMNDTGWMLTEIDVRRHAVPHSLLPDDFEVPEGSSIESFLPGEDVTEEMLAPGSYFPHCLYSFYNYPDGLVRTSVNELSSFLRAYMNGGISNGAKILEPATVEMMFTNEHFGRGLCWGTRELRSGDLIWGHGGGDPGISTYMGFRQRDNVGVLMFFNYDSPGAGGEEIMERLFELGADAAGE
jgi:CubicO group peptidase (beta-lactamase class C family)